MKKINRLLTLVLIIMLAFMQTPAMAADNEDGGTSSDEQAAQAVSSSDEDAYISSLSVKSIVDGTTPFDDDDLAGNDSSSSNLIVRTFDSVSYTFEYTVSSSSSSSQTLSLEFSLSGDPSAWRWDTDVINYLDDMTITLTRESGAEEEISDYDDFEYDADDLVVAQVLTGTLEIGEGSVNGTLAAGIDVLAAANGDTFAPTLAVSVDGSQEKEICPDAITVSAAAKYNICLKRNSYVEHIGYFNLADGTYSKSQQSEDDIYGMVLGYGITLQLYNDSTSKGLKGIELPSGDITFDITLSETFQSSSSDTAVTNADGFEPVLWEYRENQSGNSSTKGYLGRTVYFSSTSTVYARGTVGNKDTTRNWKYCYDGGTWTITEDEEEEGVYHVTVSGYSFDLEQFHFPTGAIDYSTGQSLTGYGTYIGAFSAGYIQYICQADISQVTEYSTLVSSVTVSGLSASTLSGEDAEQETLSSDNTSSVTADLSPSGTISKQNWWGSSSGSKLGTIANSYKDSYAYAGQTVTVWAGVQLSLNLSLASLNILQKIDADYVEDPSLYAYTLANTTDSDKGDITVLFAAKTDGTNWTDQDEMNTTDEEELIYFLSADDLVSAGYVCVGILYEIRNAEIYGTHNWSDISIRARVTIKDDVESGTVITTENDVRAWKTADVVSYTEILYGTTSDGIQIYGLGDTETNWGSSNSPSKNTYYLTDADGNDTGYVTPDYDLRYDGYTAVEYSNGTISGGGNGGYSYGNSILVIGAKNTIDISVADTTSSGLEKSSYNLGNGETTVTYCITPALTSVSETSGETSTDLTVVVTVPSEMDISDNDMEIEGETSAGYQYACSWEENSDGSWTATYIIYDVEVGTSVGSVYLVAEIDTDAVEHGDTLTVTASVYSDLDPRACTSTNGNLSSTTISIIELTSTSFKKTVDKTISESGEDITFTISYTNSSDDAAEDIYIIDALPAADGGTASSDFSGSYRVSEVTADFSNAPDTYSLLSGAEDGLILCYTDDDALEDATDENVYSALSEGLTQSDGGYEDAQGVSWQIAGEGDFSDDAAVFDVSLEATAVMLVISAVEAGETIYISITLSFEDSSGDLYTDSEGDVQQPGDLYANIAFQYQGAQQSAVASNRVSTRIAQRSISGILWKDEDGDGLQDDGEEAISGITVSLLTSSGQAAYDACGNAVADVVTDEDGSYAFQDLPAGTYTVRFAFDDSPWEDIIYKVTEKDVGDDDSIDSDASALSGASSAIIEITDIVLPAADELSLYVYVSENNDAGVAYRTASLMIYKVDSDDTDTYIEGAVYELYSEDGEYITALTTSEEGTGYDGLIAGDYYLVETYAPDGYFLNKTQYDFSVDIDDLDGTVTIVLKDNLLSMLANSGGTGISILVILALLSISTALLVSLSIRKKRI